MSVLIKMGSIMESSEKKESSLDPIRYYYQEYYCPCLNYMLCFLNSLFVKKKKICTDGSQRVQWVPDCKRFENPCYK